MNIAVTQETTDRANRIYDRIRPTNWVTRIRGLMTANEPPRVGLRKLLNLADEVASRVGTDVACKRKCSHCCHIAVGVLEPEAQLIAERTGHKLHKPEQWRTDFESFALGYKAPCPFLKNDECSIYANRPLACRIHFNVGVSVDPCRLDSIKTVPQLNLMPFNTAYVAVCKTMHLADIRDYFHSC